MGHIAISYGKIEKYREKQRHVYIHKAGGGLHFRRSVQLPGSWQVFHSHTTYILRILIQNLPSPYLIPTFHLFPTNYPISTISSSVQTQFETEFEKVPIQPTFWPHHIIPKLPLFTHFYPLNRHTLPQLSNIISNSIRK